MKNNTYLLIFLLVFLCGCASAPRYTTGPTHLSTKSKASKTSNNKTSKSNNVKHRKVMNGVSSFYAEDFQPSDVHYGNVMMRPSTNELVITDVGNFKGLYR